MMTTETSQQLVVVLETLQQALNHPKETAQWTQAQMRIEEAIMALTSTSSSSKPSTNQSIDQVLEQGDVQYQPFISSGTYNLFEKLSECIQIDPNSIYRSRAEEEEKMGNSNDNNDRLAPNQLKTNAILDLQVQCISNLIDLINIISPSANQQQYHHEAKYPHRVNTSGEEEGRNTLDPIDVSFRSISGLIFYLSAWCSVGYSIDEWVLDLSLQNRIQNLIEKLWQLVANLDIGNPRIRHDHKSYKKILELEYGYIILNDFIKPLFMKQDSFSHQIDLKTGRTKHRKHHQNGNKDLNQDHLFGPTFKSSVDLFNNQLWKIHAIGFWNSVCLLLDRLHQEPGIIEIWPLLIPPIITLLEETHARYRLRGIQLSMSLLTNAPPHIICSTGINDLLQKVYSNTFGLLNIQETIELLNASFEANMKLIEVEWDASSGKDSNDQARKYDKINRLFQESIFNAIAFRKSYGDQIPCYDLNLLDFVVTRFAQLAELLHFAIGRYIQVIVPYLIESLMNLQELNSMNYKLVVKINKLIKLLFMKCGEVLMEWRSRFVIVFAICWQKWINGNDDGIGETFSSSAHPNMKKKDELEESALESVKLSIIHDVFKSFIKIKYNQKPASTSSSISLNNQNDQKPIGSNLHPQEQQEHVGKKKLVLDRECSDKYDKQLFDLIDSIHHTHPVLTELFKPFL